MRNLATVPIVVLLFFLFAATPSTAEIKSKKIRSDERSQILFDNFKFTNSGHVSIAVSSVSVKFLPVISNISRPDPSRFGFFLLSKEARYQFNIERGISCDLDSKFISLIFTFSNTSFTTFNESYPVTYPNDYSLYFANCNPFTHVSMDVRTELYNMVDNGNKGRTKDYLSAAMTKLPSLYFIFSLIYLVFLAMWIFVCVINHKSVHIVHLVMGLLLVSKAIYLLCAFEVEHSVKLTGSRSHDQWDVLLYVFQFITFALLYTVIAIIFDGWSFFKQKAKRHLILVIPLQALSTVVTIVCHQIASPFSRLGLMGVDAMIWLAIMVPIIESDIALENEQAARNYNCTLFLWSSSVVALYLLIINCYLGGMNKLFQSNKWETYEEEEIITLVFYILMFSFFMPFERNEYFVQLYEAKAVRDVGVEL